MASDWGHCGGDVERDSSVSEGGDRGTIIFTICYRKCWGGAAKQGETEMGGRVLVCTATVLVAISCHLQDVGWWLYPELRLTLPCLPGRKLCTLSVLYS